MLEAQVSRILLFGLVFIYCVFEKKKNCKNNDKYQNDKTLKQFINGKYFRLFFQLTKRLQF